MTYNNIMKNEKITDAVFIVRFTSLLLIGYIVILATINILLGRPVMPLERWYNLLYYVLNIGVALICLGLSTWQWLQKKYKSLFIPAVIVITTVLPIIINYMVVNRFPLGDRFTPDNPSLRLIPFLFTGLLLAAWQYNWPIIILVIAGITGLNLFFMYFFQIVNNTQPFQGSLSTLLIQIIIFLALGFSTNFLMKRLRKQQESLEAANIRLTHYTSTLEQLTASRERNRLARELHDTLAHTLSGLSVQMETIKAYWDIEPQTARALFDKSLAAAHSGLEETRRALKALRASSLDDLGLALSISATAKDMATRANIHLDLAIPDKLPSLSPDVEQCIYRVAQEAITNAVNHSRAKNLKVQIEVTGNKLLLTIQDDGIGFNAEKNEHENHFGLRGMEERAELVGGQLVINSRHGSGTTIQLSVNQEK